MTDNCPYCGTPLKKTNLKRYFCMNYGIVARNEDAEEKGDDDESLKSYVG